MRAGSIFSWRANLIIIRRFQRYRYITASVIELLSVKKLSCCLIPGKAVSYAAAIKNYRNLPYSRHISTGLRVSKLSTMNEHRCICHGNHREAYNYPCFLPGAFLQCSFFKRELAGQYRNNRMAHVPIVLKLKVNSETAKWILMIEQKV